MDTIETKNARIDSTMLGIEDHGIFTFVLHLNYGGSGQGAGMYVLSTPPKSPDATPKEDLTGALIMRILAVVGVDSWEKLPGQHIRVKADYGKVHAIGNLLEDRWIAFDAFFKSGKK